MTDPVKVMARAIYGDMFGDRKRDEPDARVWDCYLDTANAIIAALAAAGYVVVPATPALLPGLRYVLDRAPITSAIETLDNWLRDEIARQEKAP